MTKLVYPSPVKRTLVALADFVLFLFVVLGFFAAGQAIANASPYGNGLKEAISSYQLDSGLYYLNEDGNAAPYDNLARYDAYEEKLVRYYTVYLKSECPEDGRKNYDIYWYNVHVLGLEDTKGLYRSDEILEPAKSKGKQLFQYVEAGVDVLGVPNASLHEGGDIENPIGQTALTQLLHFYYSPSAQNSYYNAGRDLYFSSFYQRDLSAYQNITSVVPVAASVFLSGLIFYLLFPMVLKDGATLCKKAFGLGVLSAGGYAVKKSQVLLRQIPQIVAATLLFLFVPFTFAVMIASFSLLVSYALSIFTSKHQAVHDFIGFTMVIDAKNSLFYKTPEEEEASSKAFDAAMEEAERLKEEGEKMLQEEAKEKAKASLEKK